MNLADATEPQVVSVEAHHDDRLQILESAMGTVAAVNRFIANFERVKEERDSFEKRLADAHAENEKLRKKINDGEDRHGQLSKSVTAITDEIETIAARCLEAVKVVRAQIAHPASPITQLSLPMIDKQSPAEPAAVLSPPIAAAQLTDIRTPVAEHSAQPSAVEANSSPIAEASRVVQVFSQYLTQPARVTRT
jgi:septal ring factor EnvC (AmiA/AmiB activator)